MRVVFGRSPSMPVTRVPREPLRFSISRGEIDVIFSVDMFNEGVDVPNIDTVLMLRPTESTVIWMQQFGRGLAQSTGKAISESH